MDNSHSMFEIIGRFISIAMGFTVVVSALWNMRKTSFLKKNGFHTRGTIVKILTPDDLDYPVVGFKTYTGEYIENKLRGRSPTSYKIGQEVEVFYNSENPKEFVVNSNAETIYIDCFLLLLGLVFVIGGLYSESFK
jgi:Protein of unknown function (DUF3592)